MNKEVKSIIFYSNKGEENYKEQAFLEFSDSTYEFTNIEKAKIKTTELLKIRKAPSIKTLIQDSTLRFIHKKSFNEYFKDNYLENLTKKIADLLDDAMDILDNKFFENYMVSENEKEILYNKAALLTDIIKDEDYEAMTNYYASLKKEIEEIEETYENYRAKKMVKIDNNKKRKRRGLKLKIGAAAMLLGMGGYCLKTIDDLVSLSSIESNRDDIDMSQTKIVKLLANEHTCLERICFIESILNYMTNYNGYFANEHKEEDKKTKPALSFNEIAAEQLVYNTYSYEEVAKIFGSSDAVFEIFAEDYLEATAQEEMAHTIQKTTTNKREILANPEGKEFYTKYEEMLISFNTEEDLNKKKKIAKKFFNSLRSDFNLENNDTNIDDYKLSIIPIINSINAMCTRFGKEYHLSDTELNYFNSKLYVEKVVKKLKTYEKEVAKIKEYYADTKEEISFDEYQDTLISDVKKLKLYNVNNVNRDISSYSEYKKNVNDYPINSVKKIKK